MDPASVAVSRAPIGQLINVTSALLAASFNGHKGAVRFLLETGADVNAQDGVHGDALSAASFNGHKEVVRLLLETGADVNARGGVSGNALSAASFNGHERVVRLLLETGADVNVQGGDYGNPLSAASFNGHERVVRLLLNAGTDVNARGGIYGNALLAASSNGHKRVVRLLLVTGANVNAQDGVHGNALSAASFNGHERVVRLLLETGADVNVQGGDYYGNPLSAASFNGHERVVRLLLNAGTDVNARGGIYGNALLAASSNGHKRVVRLLLVTGANVNTQDGVHSNALSAASFNGHERVVRLLLERGADVNVQGGDYYGNPLSVASFNGHERVVRLLLNAGTDVNARGGNYGNALLAASSNGHKRVVRLLLVTGANVNAQDGVHGNALSAASFNGHERVVQLLLKTGADVNAQGGFYGNALSVASHNGHEGVVRLLLETGADVNARGGVYGYALSAASFSGHKGVVRLLLEKKPDVNARGGDYGNALSAASFNGHEGVVRLLLEKGADADAEGGAYGNALSAASFNGHEGVMRLLLETGVDVNARGGVHGNALSAASFNGHEGVVRLLLEPGADVNAQGGVHGNALSAASSKGHEGVVRLLLETGADVNARGGFYGNALSAASKNGHKGVVRLLLETGVDVNVRGGAHGNALSAASFNGHEGVVRLLLETGADVNARGGVFGNALSVASTNGHNGVVQLLLEKGAKFSAKAAIQGIALSVASSNDGHEDESPGLNPEKFDLPVGVKNDELSGLDGSMESENISMANRITGKSLHQTYLRSPRAYYEKLKDLKDEVCSYSALALTIRLDETGEPFSYPEAIERQIADWLKAFVDFQSFGYSNQPSPRICTLRSEICSHLKTCRDIIMAAYSNVWRLQRTGFTQNRISILAIDPSRSSVANLMSVSIEEIKALAQMFCCATESLCRVGPDLEPMVGNLTRSCDRLLSYLHLSTRPPEADFIEYYPTDADCSRCWDDTVRLLDLAVLIYAGAHIDPLPDKIKSIAEHPKRGSQIQLQTRPLKCLSPILGEKEAWIFSLQTVVSQSEFYISSSPDVFADIWGPMWKVYSENDRSILRYNVGSGSIVPWEYKSEEHPQLKDHERLGHWMTLGSAVSGSHNYEVNPWLPTGNSSEGDQSEGQESSESEPEEAVEGLDISPKSSSGWHAYATAHAFSGSESLLIGAQTNPKLVWSNCRCPTHRITHRLKEKQLLHFLNTSKLFHYVDSKNLGMVAGSHGLTIGANITIKTQNGRPWKDVLLEAWENQPDARDPRTLESFWGVMISLCTYNARRVRLTELLGTDSIKNLLKPFPWSDSYIRNQFFDAISSSDPFALSRLWAREKNLQEELGKVLLTCLRALCNTGYDAKRGELNALWMSLKSTGPKRVVLKPLEHCWVQILQDSEDSFAMAVMVKKCLGISSAEHGLQSCIQEGGWHAPSRLETAIAINHEIQNSTLDRAKMCQEDLDMWRTADHTWKKRWDVSSVNQGELFWIACPQARLKAVGPLTNSHLLMEWNDIKRDQIREIIGLEPDSARLGHWEYTDDQERPPVRPIPVHIL